MGGLRFWGHRLVRGRVAIRGGELLVVNFPVPGLKLLAERQRSKRAELLDHLVDDAAHLVALGGGDPLEAYPLIFDSKVCEHSFQQLESPQCLEVALGVMAVADVAPADEHAVGVPGKRGQDELRVHASGAHQANYPYVRRILEPRDTGEIRCGVGAPVAEECHDPWLPFRVMHGLALLRFH